MRAWDLPALALPCSRTFTTACLLGTGKCILHFDEEPLLLASSFAAHTDERELALEFLTVQRKLQLTGFDALRHRLRARPVCEHVS